MDGQDRRHVLECRPKVQGGPDGHSHQWLHSVFPATLVLVEQKVKVSLPSASNSLLTDCTARGSRPRDIKAHISIQAAPQRLGLRALLAQALLLVGKRRAVSLRRPPHHHHQHPSYPKPCVETAMKATEPCLHPPSFPSRPRFLPGRAPRHLEGRAAYCQILRWSQPSYLLPQTGQWNGQKQFGHQLSKPGHLGSSISPRPAAENIPSAHSKLNDFFLRSFVKIYLFKVSALAD